MGQIPHAVRSLTYCGDVTSIVGEIKGPTTMGEFVTAVSADFDSGSNTTRVGFAYGAFDEDWNRLDGLQSDSADT